MPPKKRRAAPSKKAAPPKKRRKASSPTVTAPVTATSCRPRPAMREKLIKWKLSGYTVAITAVTVPLPPIPSS